jgi:hypothetical protein
MRTVFPMVITAISISVMQNRIVVSDAYTLMAKECIPERQQDRSEPAGSLSR